MNRDAFMNSLKELLADVPEAEREEALSYYEEYFEDDIVGRYVEFVRVVYGKDTLEENLKFIADALGNKGNTSREIIRNYFLNDFINDHNKTYQKRPIYWLFDSGKQNGFKALCYMHRWNADTTGNMRVEYLHKMQRVYENVKKVVPGDVYVAAGDQVIIDACKEFGAPAILTDPKLSLQPHC